MIGIAEMMAGMVECVAGQGMIVSTRDIRADMGMDEILMAALDLGVCIYSLLWLMFREVDKASVTGRTNTILFRVDF